MKHLQHASPLGTTAGVLLDQEKAYNRVHPDYLRSVMLHMGFPSVLVDSLTALFFGTSIHLSINDWLSAPVPQIEASDKGIRYPIKLLTYADGIILFLRNAEEWTTLQSLLTDYGEASNAKINLGKTTVLPMTGQSREEWRTLASREHITWHD